MTNLFMLILCFIAGMLLRRSGRMPDNAPAALNSFIIHVSLPALTLLYIHDMKFSLDVGLMAAMAWISFSMAAGFFWLAGRWLKLPRGTVGALMLTGGLGNTSFFGLPMIEVYYGQEGIASGIIVDQLGSFLVLSTLGLTVAGLYSSGRPSTAEILRRIALFPPFIALTVALLLIPLDYAPWFTLLLKRLGDTLARPGGADGCGWAAGFVCHACRLVVAVVQNGKCNISNRCLDTPFRFPLVKWRA